MKKHTFTMLILILLISILQAVTVKKESDFGVNADIDNQDYTISQFGDYEGSIYNASTTDDDYWKIYIASPGTLTISINLIDNYYRLRLYKENKIDYIGSLLTPETNTYSSEYTINEIGNYYIRLFYKSPFSLTNYKFTVTSGTATLPVELSSFNAFLTNTNNVSLNWTSQSESNMVGYNVFRANSNQQSDAVKINPAIIAATNTSSEQNYSFTDHSIDAGEYYYWLQSVEANNETAFHGPVHVSYNPGTGMPDPEYQYSHLLKGAYPNPFNPSTSIQYELAEAANVEIVIFNAKGQKVRTFNQSHNNKGTYDVLWDGLDENGASVNSGVYFYRMTAGKSVQSKKMLLVK
jgi:hypothetical protein